MVVVESVGGKWTHVQHMQRSNVAMLVNLIYTCVYVFVPNALSWSLNEHSNSGSTNEIERRGKLHPNHHSPMYTCLSSGNAPK